jgi:ferredoxin
MSFKIEFKKSAKTFEWEEIFGNLLDFAEAKGIQMESNCRIGVCGSCKVKLISGKVVMESEDALEEKEREQNLILPCVAVPQTDLVIDA